MKTLAECFVVAYEGSSPSSKLGTFESLNVNALKAVKSTIAVGFVAVGVFAGTAVQAETVQKTLSLQSTSGMVTVNENVQAPLQYGQAQLINDKPYPKIIYFREQGKGSTPRFAYLPGCTKRTLASTYSNRWEYSGDNEAYTTFGTSAQGLFTLKTSHLRKQDNGLACFVPSSLASQKGNDSGRKLEWHKQEGEGIVAEPVGLNQVGELLLNSGKKVLPEMIASVERKGPRYGLKAFNGQMLGGNAGRDIALARTVSDETLTPTGRFIQSEIKPFSTLTEFEAGQQLIEKSATWLKKDLKSVIQNAAKGNDPLVVADRSNVFASEFIEMAATGKMTEEDFIAMKRKLIATVEDGGCGYTQLNPGLIIDKMRLFAQLVNVTRREMGQAGDGTQQAKLVKDHHSFQPTFQARLDKLKCANYDRTPSVKGSLVVSRL